MLRALEAYNILASDLSFVSVFFKIFCFYSVNYTVLNITYLSMDIKQTEYIVSVISMENHDRRGFVKMINVTGYLDDGFR